MRKISYLAAGGTIASTHCQSADGVTPSLSADDLVASIPQVADVCEVRAVQVSQLPSPSLSFDELRHILELAREEIANGADGIVVSHGTDTIEETSYFFDLLWDLPQPFIVTGAMRNPDQPGGEGPANLLAAFQTAASDSARNLGVLVVLNEQIHAARFVKKSHTFAASTFRSPIAGPLGWVVEGRAVIRTLVPRLPALKPGDSIPPVALVKITLDDDARILTALKNLGYQGVVIEGMGGGHVPAIAMENLTDAASELPIVLTSRAGAGEVMRQTYYYKGSEIDLQKHGVMPAGALDGLKARLLLALLLSSGASESEIKEELARRG